MKWLYLFAALLFAMSGATNWLLFVLIAFFVCEVVQ